MRLIMKKKLAVVAALASISTLIACSKPMDTVEKTTKSTTTSPQGTVETTSQATTTSPQGTVETTAATKQVGSTLEGKTETSRTTDEGTVKTNIETFVGTVTVYEAGKKIEVLTGENTRHTVELDGKDVVSNIAGPVMVGARVRLVEEKTDRGTRVSVTPEGRT
jgi:hypothetical protein